MQPCNAHVLSLACLSVRLLASPMLNRSIFRHMAAQSAQGQQLQVQSSGNLPRASSSDGQLISLRNCRSLNSWSVRKLERRPAYSALLYACKCLSPDGMPTPAQACPCPQ